MQNESDEETTEQASLRSQAECAHLTLQAFLQAGGFTRDEAFLLTRDNFGQVFMAREYAAREIAARRTIEARPTVVSTAVEPSPTFQINPSSQKLRSQPPVESTEQAVALFAGAIVNLIDELVSQGLERSDCIDLAGNAAHSLAHYMGSRLCPP